MSTAFPALGNEAFAPSRDQVDAVLSRALARSRPGARIVEIERTPCAYGSSWWLEDITLHLDDGSRVGLVFKDLDREANGSGARRVKPAFATNPAREPWAYRTLLWQTAGPPKLFAAGHDWLVVGRVQGTPLSEIGNRQAWCAAARWLGHFHATAPVPHHARGPLLQHDHGYHRAWLARATAVAEKAACRAGAHAGAQEKLERLRALRPVHEHAIDEALAAGRSLIHGEFYPPNVLVEETGMGYTVHPIDWEMAGFGPSQLDLAALTSGWDLDDRTAMASAYLDGASAAGARCPPLDELLHRVTACRLLYAVQWLGWAAGWIAPAAHRNDWLEEAERCGEELRG